MLRKTLPILIGILTGLQLLQAQTGSPVKVYVEQNGRRYLLNNSTVTLERAPFTLIVEFDQPDRYNGIYINTSYKRDYFNLFPSQPIPDFRYLPQKVLSEYKFNPNKELKIHREYFQYLGFNPKRNWFKFDRIEKKDGKVIGYRSVRNLDLVQQDKRIPVSRNHKDIYLFFTVLKKDPASLYGHREITRFKAKLKFRQSR